MMSDQASRRVVGQCTIHEDHDNLLGSGGFGSVFKGSMPIAAKKIPLRPQSKIQRSEKLPFERGLSHPSIVRIFDIKYVGTDLWVIMEQCDCNFKTYLKEDKPPDDQKLSNIRQVANAMNFLHKKKICHRDIKPENILVVNRLEDPMVKLADFGLVKELEESSNMFSNCGTDKWKAPELFKDHEEKIPYSIAIDIFSFGLVVLYSSVSEEDREHSWGSCECN